MKLQKKKGKTSNGKQGTLQSCLNACHELESWVENGLVWSGLVWFGLVLFLDAHCSLCFACCRKLWHLQPPSKSRRSSCIARDYFALNIVLSLQ